MNNTKIVNTSFIYKFKNLITLKVLFKLLILIQKDNKLYITSNLRKNIISDLNISESSFTRALSQLIDFKYNFGFRRKLFS